MAKNHIVVSLLDGEEELSVTIKAAAGKQGTKDRTTSAAQFCSLCVNSPQLWCCVWGGLQLAMPEGPTSGAHTCEKALLQQAVKFWLV